MTDHSILSLEKVQIITTKIARYQQKESKYNESKIDYLTKLEQN